MQEDIENKSLTLIINTGKLTGRTMATAFMKLLRYSRNRIREHRDVKPQGKQSVKKLIGQNQGVEKTELADREEAKNLRPVRQTVRRGLCHPEGHLRGWQAKVHPFLQGPRPGGHRPGHGSLCYGMEAAAQERASPCGAGA